MLWRGPQRIVLSMSGARDFDRGMFAGQHSVFTYGTLLFPAVMAALTGRQLSHCKAVLPGYRRLLVRGRVYPAIVPDPKAHTAGVLYDNLDSTSLEMLDRFEGDLYQLDPVTVIIGDGSRRRAVAYILDPGRRSELTDEPWDSSAFAARHLARYRAACRAFRIAGGGPG